MNNIVVGIPTLVSLQIYI